jgi:hypothetical protein
MQDHAKENYNLEAKYYVRMIHHSHQAGIVSYLISSTFYLNVYIVKVSGMSVLDNRSDFLYNNSLRF